VRVSGRGHGCGGPELGRTVEEWKRVRAGPECRLEDHPFHPVMWLSSSVRRGSWGRDSEDLMERTVVRCAEGHVFSTASFPMQQAERLGPGRLVRCPRCARLRSVVPVMLEKR
jgi:formate-dependent nitrite reductase complex subunit NrfF